MRTKRAHDREGERKKYKERSKVKLKTGEATMVL